MNPRSRNHRSPPLRPAAAALISVLLILSACQKDDDPWTGWPTDLPPSTEDAYHYDGVDDPYYEGWYYKVALPDRDEAFFFIYTVVNPFPGTAYPSEAFLYCGRASTLETVYQSFPPETFEAAREHRDARIDENARATALRFAGRAEQNGLACDWDIRLEDGVPWEETMGWMTGATDLETSWAVGVITARASGWIRFGGEYIEFQDGIGYSDHNWGTVFPRQWIWLQANGFADPGTALSLSGGTVPVGHTEMEAHMIGFLLDGEIITFRTQDGDEIAADAVRGHWLITGTGPYHRITVEAWCDPVLMFHLLAPTENGMQPRAWESLAGTVSVILEERESADASWREKFQGTSDQAGVELGD